MAPDEKESTNKNNIRRFEADNLPDIPPKNKTGSEPVKDHLDFAADADLREQVLPLCRKTQITLREFDKQFDQLMKFHKEQLSRGDINYMLGKNRIDALKNLEMIGKEMQATNRALQNLIMQIQQQAPALDEAEGLKLGSGGTFNAEKDEQDETDSAG